MMQHLRDFSRKVLVVVSWRVTSKQQIERQSLVCGTTVVANTHQPHLVHLMLNISGRFFQHADTQILHGALIKPYTRAHMLHFLCRTDKRTPKIRLSGVQVSLTRQRNIENKEFTQCCYLRADHVPIRRSTRTNVDACPAEGRV